MVLLPSARLPPFTAKRRPRASRRNRQWNPSQNRVSHSESNAPRGCGVATRRLDGRFTCVVAVAAVATMLAGFAASVVVVATAGVAVTIAVAAQFATLPVA